MERTKYIFLILIFYIPVSSFGQTNQTIYKAYISGDMELWKLTIDSMRPKTNKEKLDLINYQYGYIAWCIDQDKRQQAKEYMQKSEKLIRQLEKESYLLSMLFAYKAAFVGFEIGLNTYKAPFIGPKSLDFAEESAKMDSRNMFAYVQLGNIAYYTPRIFGGSKTEAIQYYLKAVKEIEKDINGIKNNWNYLNLLITISNAYFETDQYEEAKLFCDLALDAEPHFDWVKNVLYPRILKKI